MIPNGNEIHYISSGMSHSRINSVNVDTKHWIHAQLAKLNNENYKFGFLYNAFTERRLGEIFSTDYANHVCDIHADSGGLQMVTLGMTVDEAMKTKIYKHQAKHSTIAMSFDEIPVSSAGQSVTDFANRVFNTHLVEEKAIASGKNLVAQLRLFAEEKTKSKPLLIAQGNCLDTYRRWVDLVQAQIPTELLGGLGGIAMAGASMGGGDLENVRTAFYYTQMDMKFACKQVHLLGVGSLSRFLPTMVFMRSGLYKDLIISIDSTTATGGVSRGDFNGYGGKLRSVGRFYNEELYTELFNYMKFFEPDIHSPEELFKYFVNSPTISDMREAGRHVDVERYIQAKFGTFLVSAKNTLDSFVEYLDGKNHNILVRKSMQSPMRHLHDVKDLSDYNAWERNFAKYIKTKAVPVKASNNLEEFFA